jgi:hypothetical protein
MKVKCISTKRLDNEGTYQALTIGKEYIVLAIEFYDKSISTFSNSLGDFIVYRLKDNDGVVIPYPSKLFNISSGKLPSCWVSYKRDDGSFSILPDTWAREYFWDDYYNDEDGALEDFTKSEKEIICSS